MEQSNIPQSVPYAFPPKKPPVTFPTGKGELLFGLWTLVFSMLLCNCLFYPGPGLVFAAAQLALMGGTAFYLIRRGHRFGRYEAALLILCAFVAAGFIKSDDGGMKFLMILLLMAMPALSFAIAAGQNRWKPGGVLSLLDSPRATFGLGVGRLGEAGRGIRAAFRSAGTLGRNTGAVGIGLLVAVPVLAMMIPLLMSADAAFEGLLDLLPEWDLEEALTTAILGSFLGILLYTRGVALHHETKAETAPKPVRGVHPLTVNTILFAAAAVYLVYLFSQLAYFVGGFSGILPEDFTLAEYARRGFFEMSELCAINLALIALGVGLVKKEDKTPLSTRLVCLFLGAITAFLVAAASAKMFMYIGSYGLTRARVMTEVFMLWLAITTIAVCVWLFRAKLPYMKVSVMVALVLCAGLFWADVDAQVARYNVRAYQSGQLETVDVEYLSRLSSGAVPYLEALTRDRDPDVAQEAREELAAYRLYQYDDLRGWNWTAWQAAQILEPYQPDEAAEAE
ncbi:MAG: DUF4173 domain-containing protein [Oscillospiraceae bacterium]|nr:DUF4173 domain-containing protein [Oscillospiraceae bacterium]